MIRVTFYKDSGDKYIGFSLKGHAGYAKAGRDIVCAAVSALCINTLNSIKTFTQDTVRIMSDEKQGVIKLRFIGAVSPESRLFVDSLKLGLENIELDHRVRYLSVMTKRRCRP